MIWDFDHWQEIYNALLANKLRTFLTAFGVFWGLFMLVIMLGSGTGLSNGVMQEYAGSATNSFFVWTNTTSKPYRGLVAGRSFSLRNDDVAAIREKVPDADVIAPRLQLGGFRGGNNVARGTKTGAFSVTGDQPAIRELQSLRLTRGRFLNQLDLDERRKVAVAGSRVVEVLFESHEDPLGQEIRINGVYFTVIGTFRSSRSGEEGDEDAQTIYTPFTTFQSAFNMGDRVGWMAITARSGVPASRVEEQVLTLLKARHQIAPDDKRALGHWNMEEEFRKIQGLFAGIRLLVWIVGIGTLAAGVIGVSNIMLMIVRDRTKEIGIRRAIGARPATIIGQVMLEAVLLTSVAGCLGLSAGVAALEVTSHLIAGPTTGPRMFMNPEVQLDTALKALAILVVAGILAGLMPARRAVSVNPVVALRAE